VKLYADESEHEHVRRLHGPFVISAIAHVEVVAAIWRKHRIGELGLDDALILLRAFAVDYAGTPDKPPRFIALAIADGVIARAAALAGTHALRAYGAVQLASAVTAREIDAGCNAFACFDRALTCAAIAEGFKAPLG
jgi:predicted nucleic acid-binding protein